MFGGANLGPFATATAPSGVGTVGFAATATAVTATLTGSTLVTADHVASVLLLDAATGLPVPGISYGPITKTTSTASGALATVTVPLPASPPVPLPSMMNVYLMVDTYPAATGSVVLP